MSSCNTVTGGPIALGDIKAVQNDDVSIVYSTVTIDGVNLPTSSTLELYLVDRDDEQRTFTLSGTQSTSDESQWRFLFDSLDNTENTVYNYTMRLTDTVGDRRTLALGKIYINSDL